MTSTFHSRDKASDETGVDNWFLHFAGGEISSISACFGDNSPAFGVIYGDGRSWTREGQKWYEVSVAWMKKGLKEIF